MSDEHEWAHLVNVSSGLDADMIRAVLDVEGIPALIRGHQTGFYGGAFQGPLLGGVDVHVPQEALEAARKVLARDDRVPESGGE